MCWALLFKGHTFFMHTNVIQSCRFTSVYITFYWTPGVKGCVHYLNKRSTSPTYILYQLNEQKISYHIFFNITHCRFQKKQAASNPHPFHYPRCVYEIYYGKIEASQFSVSFQIVSRIAMPTRIPLPQLQNYYPLYWEIKSSKQ